jgi:uncharacterized protein YoxC
MTHLNLNNETILTAFVALTGLAMMVQAMVLLAIYISVRKAVRSMHDEFEDLRASAMPLIDHGRGFFINAQKLLTRIAPNLEASVADLADVSQRLRVHAADLESSAADVLERMRHLTGRLDAMVSGILDSVDRAGNYVSEAVSRPVRQVSGLLASVKAVVETLRTPVSKIRRTRNSTDTEPFI